MQFANKEVVLKGARTGGWSSASVEAALRRFATAPTVSWLLAINSLAALVFILGQCHENPSCSTSDVDLS
jgi:apolipoprotein N-acyltransferase